MNVFHHSNCRMYAVYSRKVSILCCTISSVRYCCKISISLHLAIHVLSMFGADAGVIFTSINMICYQTPYLFAKITGSLAAIIKLSLGI